jgi:hypothetical protein
MKKYIKFLVGVSVITCFTASSCKKEFFNRTPEDALTLDNFYQTAEQVRTSTNGLYTAPWFNFNNKAFWAITELSGGNGRTYSSDVVNFGNFSVTADNTELSNAWRSLFTVVAQSNALIINLPLKVPASVSPAVVNNALGEAHLMRGLAYFYLVRLFGNVPIIENSADFILNYQVNTNTVDDVYKFIINDLKFAEANCTAVIRSAPSSAQGHVSSGSATALLAKVYLYMQDYANARTAAQKVINSGEFKLYDGVEVSGKTYDDLFRTANNNNEESIIALQWAAGASYGRGNSVQASFAFQSIITGTGDGYGVLAPSIDLQNEFKLEPGDKRLHATIMLANDKYPEINQAAGGYTVPADVNAQNSRAAIKKYVVGTPADNGGRGASQSTGMNTYLMRYADVYLIAAEAILAGGTSTTDLIAIGYVNKIRVRAGLAPIRTNGTGVLTLNEILHQRRLEFAIEGDYWFDLGRLDGYKATSHPKAIAIIANQERGTYSGDTPPVIFSEKYTPTNANFKFPYPTTETALNPKLLEPPVPYVFK